MLLFNTTEPSLLCLLSCDRDFFFSCGSCSSDYCRGFLLVIDFCSLVKTPFQWFTLYSLIKFLEILVYMGLRFLSCLKEVEF